MTKFDAYIEDLLGRPEVRKLSRQKDHHFKEDRLEHSLRTARLSYRAACLFRADARVCARAALLHDWYFEARSEHENRVGANVHHYRIAEANARGIGESVAVTDAIASHMWPYGRRPKTREAWIVWMADNITWVTDGLKSSVKYLRKKFRFFLYGRSSKETTHAG